MNKKFLLISPHLDDCELGMGGTISKLIEIKYKPYYLGLSLGVEKETEETIIKENSKAMKALGISHKQVFIENFANREFNKQRQELLQTLLDYRKKINPSIVFIPSKYDMHQDHQVIYKESLRAFKNSQISVFCYEEPWNCFKSKINFFSVLTKKQVAKKINSLQYYKSQKTKKYFKKDFVLALARVRGVQTGVQFAEAFEVSKLIF